MKNLLYFWLLFMTSICVAQNQKMPKNLNVLALFKDSSSTNYNIMYSEGLGKVKKNIPYDSIPPNTNVVVNGIRFQHKEILRFIPNHTIDWADTKFFRERRLKPDEKISAFADTSGLSFAERIKETLVKEAIVTQHNDDFLVDFFFFDDTNLAAHRYRCYAETPVFDLLMDKGDAPSETPVRFIIDGRLQDKNFDPASIKSSEIVTVNVHERRIAERFWGREVRNGLVVIHTRAKIATTIFQNTSVRVIGEKQSKNGEWIVEKDTILADEPTFRQFREETIFKNSPMYMIDGKPESEVINRKTIDYESIGMIDIRPQKLTFTAAQDEVQRKAFYKNQKAIVNNDYAGMKQYADYKKSLEPPYYKDSVFIKMSYRNHDRGRRVNLGAVQSDLRRMRSNPDETLPIYIVDEKEVSIEILRSYKSGELEMIVALEGCDAISKYGKKGINGVVIYKRKQ